MPGIPVALHARAARRLGNQEPVAKRQLSLRTVLVILALVPSVAVAALWAVNSAQLYTDWHTVSDRNSASDHAGIPIVGVFYSLEEERRLSAAALADPGTYRAKLDQQRKLTDESVAGLQAVSASAPADIARGIGKVDQGLHQLAGYRAAVDGRTATQQQSYDDYTGIITTDLELFTLLSNVGIADLDYLARPAIDSVWGKEMLSREDAVLTPGVVTGHLSGAERAQLAQLIGSQQFIYDDKVVPLLPETVAARYRTLLAGDLWKQKTRIEQAVLSAPVTQSTDRTGVSPALGAQWRQSVDQITPQLEQLNGIYAASLTATTTSDLHAMQVRLITSSAVGAVGALLVVLLTLLLTRSLRRRILVLRSAALDLETRLPELVERLRRGEEVDPDAELPEIGHGRDELGMLGRALNAARSSALETAVRQVEQYRGFERLLQRIARRTQLLIGLQMKKLNEMERRHEDAEVLEGLFGLDHLTARLRRYEENLVILSGGQPQRRWRKPVLLLDVLRSAQGEVQDYRRIRIEIEDRTWLSERAVGPMVHVLAELMENAVMFSKPPTPVEVSAAQVGRGLAIEIEDRGLGMEPEQYAAANELMAHPPRMDVISRADDARLGLYVVARLASGLGVKVELRPSSFGGTRVVVLVPAELVAAGPQETAPAPQGFGAPALSVVDALDSQQPDSQQADSRQGGDFPAAAAHPGDRPDFAQRPLIGAWSRPPATDQAPAPRMDPLPRRVRQANLVTELRAPQPAQGDPRTAAATLQEPPRPEPRRSGAAVGAFQRQSRLARLENGTDHHSAHPTHPSPGRDRTRKEDGQ